MSLGPITDRVTPPVAEMSTAVMAARRGAIVVTSRRTVAPKSFVFSAGMPAEKRPPPKLARRCRGRRLDGLRLLAHAAAPLPSCESTISR